jgi:hypothetical protein
MAASAKLAYDRAVPLLLNGTELSLNQYLTPRFARQASVERYLVFLISDECSICQRESRLWAAAIGRLSHTEDIGIIVLNVNGTELATQIASVSERRRIKCDVYNIDDFAAFSASTGLDATPRLLALDSELRIRRTARAVISEAFREVVRFLKE